MTPINIWMASCLVVTLTTVGLSALESDHPHNNRNKRHVYPNECDLDDAEACKPGYCCIKEVISFEDKDPQASTLCYPHLTLGQLCLRQTEGYLCDCAEGLTCDFKNNETYGHCILGS